MGKKQRNHEIQMLSSLYLIEYSSKVIHQTINNYSYLNSLLQGNRAVSKLFIINYYSRFMLSEIHMKDFCLIK